MLKKANVLTRPTPARRDAPYPRRGRISIHFRGGWDDPNCSSASRAPSNLAAVLRAGGLAASDCARHHPLQSEKQRVPGTPSTSFTQGGGRLGWPSLRASTEHSIRLGPEPINPECAVREHNGQPCRPALPTLRQLRRLFPRSSPRESRKSQNKKKGGGLPHPLWTVPCVTRRAKSDPSVYSPAASGPTLPGSQYQRRSRWDRCTSPWELAAPRSCSRTPKPPACARHLRYDHPTQRTRSGCTSPSRNRCLRRSRPSRASGS